MIGCSKFSTNQNAQKQQSIKFTFTSFIKDWAQKAIGKYENNEKEAGKRSKMQVTFRAATYNELLYRNHPQPNVDIKLVFSLQIPKCPPKIFRVLEMTEFKIKTFSFKRLIFQRLLPVIDVKIFFCRKSRFPQN